MWYLVVVIFILFFWGLYNRILLKKQRKENEIFTEKISYLYKEEEGSKKVINDMLEVNENLAQLVCERDDIFKSFKERNLAIGVFFVKKISELKEKNSEALKDLRTLRENFSEGY